MISKPAWVRRLGRAAYHLPPTAFWRALDGLQSDVASLPQRLRDPERRAEPWQTLHHVGGDFQETGRLNVEILRRHGALHPGDRVLDIGCGNGRVAWPLTRAIGPEGGYVGFDVSASAIRYCRRRIGRVRPNFRFEHIDVRNGIYNPRGAVAETDTRFPCADASIDIAFATSVLTHLPWTAIVRYLEETRRVLVPGGRALFTAFVLTPQVRDWAAQGQTAVALQPFGERAMTNDPHWPENAMAYELNDFEAAIEAVGLELVEVLAGEWRPEATYAGGQDLLVIRRPPA